MTYETVAGDTWDVIALKIYGDEKKAKELVEANLYYVSIVIFSAGIKLNIPEITEPISERLPPWKRGMNNVSS